MLQSISPVLLDVKTLIFNFPSDPPSMVGSGGNVLGRDFAIGYPFEFGRFLFSFLVRFGLQTLDYR